jgi:hypothetical protein
MRLIAALLIVLMLLTAGVVLAGAPSATGTVRSIELPVIETTLKPGPGLDKVSGLCGICHSLDYIPMQPPFSRAQWTGTVNKMIKVMGAPVNEEDARTVIEYLTLQYGNGS